MKLKYRYSNQKHELSRFKFLKKKRSDNSDRMNQNISILQKK